MQNVILLNADELDRRLKKIREAMRADNVEALLLADNASKYYVTGRVFSGYVYLTTEGDFKCFIMRPVELEGPYVKYIRKPEDIPALIAAPGSFGLELNTLSWSTIERLKALFPTAKLGNASAIMMHARSTKTKAEIDMIRRSGQRQQSVYERIPRLYHEGMTDIELQVEIERASRLAGCLGLFRISGDSMELFMANIIAGDNADAPSPYDFAMGGAGLDPSLPVGADGTIIKPGMTVMVDANGNYTGYMTDMTRVFSLGEISPLALKAHECSRRIHKEIAATGGIGEEARSLYELAVRIANEEELETYFMGHRQHAKFIGHGLGIEINELPVIAPRSHDHICAGQVIALEPKFVIPGVGAVGIENTYYINENGEWECLTNAPEEIISLDR